MPRKVLGYGVLFGVFFFIVLDSIWPDIGEKVDFVRFQWKDEVFWKPQNVLKFGLVWFGWFYGIKTPAGHAMPNFVYAHIKPKIYKQILPLY